MKKNKIMQITLIVFMVLLATACQPKEKKQAESLPVYQPGSIILEDQDRDDYDFERKYRIAYYRIWGDFEDPLSKEELEDFYEWFDKKAKEEGYGEFQEEMSLVSFVKRYNITREEFDACVEKFKEAHKDSLNYEEYEVPNADIIYTFDNAIINEYYRYA